MQWARSKAIYGQAKGFFGVDVLSFDQIDWAQKVRMAARSKKKRTTSRFIGRHHLLETLELFAADVTALYREPSSSQWVEA